MGAQATTRLMYVTPVCNLQQNSIKSFKIKGVNMLLKCTEKEASRLSDDGAIMITWEYVDGELQKINKFVLIRGVKVYFVS